MPEISKNTRIGTSKLRRIATMFICNTHPLRNRMMGGSLGKRAWPGQGSFVSKTPVGADVRLEQTVFKTPVWGGTF